MPNSVMMGQLRAKDESSIILSGDVRLILAPGVDANSIKIGATVTARVACRHGVLYADIVEATPATFA